MLLFSPCVVASSGRATTPARSWRASFDGDLAHTALAVPIASARANVPGHGVCTMVVTPMTVMYANVVDTLEAFTSSAHPTA